MIINFKTHSFGSNRELESSVLKVMHTETLGIPPKTRLESDTNRVTIQSKPSPTKGHHQCELTLTKTRGKHHWMTKLLSHRELKFFTSSKVERGRIHGHARAKNFPQRAQRQPGGRMDGGRRRRSGSRREEGWPPGPEWPPAVSA